MSTRLPADPQPTPSEAVHGVLRPDAVGSATMRRKLARQAAERDRATAPVVTHDQAPAEGGGALADLRAWAVAKQAETAAAAQQAPTGGGAPAPPSFGATMRMYVLMGFGMSLAFAVVRAVLGG